MVFLAKRDAIHQHRSFGVLLCARYVFFVNLDQIKVTTVCVCRYLAVICPVLLHGLYDLIATLDQGELSLIFIGFIGIMFLAAYRTVKKLSSQDRYI